MTVQEFIAKWSKVKLTERQGAQSHFNDLCEVLEHPKPTDPESFCFERGAAKHGGGDGWADVWKKDFFGWEYKGKHKDLNAAYDQLLQYRAALENPPLLVVCDMDRIIVHTNFTNTKEQTFEIRLDALATERNLEILRAVFNDPTKLKPGEPSHAITEHAAAQFGELAALMGKRGLEPHAVAHYLIRMVFCLFAEDVDLLPRGIFTDMAKKSSNDPTRFSRLVAQLFAAMSSGGEFGADVIKHFNGNLFADTAVLELTGDEIERIAVAAALEWNTVDASIFGTLFTRGIDPQKRSQLGAQYTGRDDIEAIVEPVIMTPMRREWAEVRAKTEPLLVLKTKKNRAAVEKLVTAFLNRLKRIRVLDSAGGSGNFLYVTLQKLLDLENDVNNYLSGHGYTPHFPQVNPSQLYLIEINTYAHSLAQVTVQIGYIQWLRAHGFGFPAEPILLRLDKNFLQADALFTDWPEVDFLVSNPPFLGNRFMAGELGKEYVAKLFGIFGHRLGGKPDLCCYWFEKARELIEHGKCKRVGLLATQGIRGGTNRNVLKKILKSGGIFFAESDRPWILDGATVHVSFVGFDDGTETEKQLDGKKVQQINANLTAATDTTQAQPLVANSSIGFQGAIKRGSFDLQSAAAISMLKTGGNPNGRPNSEVIYPYMNASDLTSGTRDTWIIDFKRLSENSAAQFAQPFAHVETFVKPEREATGEKDAIKTWWIHWRTRPEMTNLLNTMARFLATPRVSKHRVFAWLTPPTYPDNAVIAFARGDDYFFGVLHSRFHEVWALALGTQLREKESGFRYTPTTCFETFPFPRPTPAQEAAIAAAAKELNELRERWLNPPEWTREEVLEFPARADGPWARYVQNGVARYPRLVAKDAGCAKQLEKRTLTKLYNERPPWLDNAHRNIDAAVAAGYGWPADLSDAQILERLLSLNLERAAEEAKHDKRPNEVRPFSDLVGPATPDTHPMKANRGTARTEGKSKSLPAKGITKAAPRAAKPSPDLSWMQSAEDRTDSEDFSAIILPISNESSGTSGNAHSAKRLKNLLPHARPET